jgi:L-ascorbate metabolism protein UlaG (beta-lactamase superfamily)
MKKSFYWMGGPSWALDMDGVIFGCDPAIAPEGTVYQPFGGTRTVAPVPLTSAKEKIAVWLLTHNHADHIDEPGMALISPNARIIAHRNLESLMKGRFGHVTYLDWGEETVFTQDGLSVTIRAIPAFHGSTPEMVRIAGGVNGYFVTIGNGMEAYRIYITGDTVDDEQIYSTLGQTTVDLFIPNVGNAFGSAPGGPITLSVPLLRGMIERIKPAVTVPVHITEFDWWEMTTADLDGIPNLMVPTLGDWAKLP